MPEKVTFTINGVEKSLYEWCREKGLNISMVYRRIKRGWPEERLLEASGASQQKRTDEKTDYRRELIHELWGGEWVYVGGRAYK